MVKWMLFLVRARFDHCSESCPEKVIERHYLLLERKPNENHEMWCGGSSPHSLIMWLEVRFSPMGMERISWPAVYLLRESSCGERD
ncbi:hypothetical protein Pyn_30740 [Prunus yedoensis var. nudiflora]|uniref:Uncharacterized protein n=1 Tax=Prunus yedoensis var. nudiflora TaxID=2094558 RepID=A0A314U9A3_PRUYE|nr:hypothetical protein Pyn_30740 [Prunus yedoensis var. nudiflora]